MESNSQRESTDQAQSTSNYENILDFTLNLEDTIPTQTGEESFRTTRLNNIERSHSSSPIKKKIKVNHSDDSVVSMIRNWEDEETPKEIRRFIVSPTLMQNDLMQKQLELDAKHLYLESEKHQKEHRSRIDSTRYPPLVRTRTIDPLKYGVPEGPQIKGPIRPKDTGYGLNRPPTPKNFNFNWDNNLQGYVGGFLPHSMYRPKSRDLEIEDRVFVNRPDYRNQEVYRTRSQPTPRSSTPIPQDPISREMVKTQKFRDPRKSQEIQSENDEEMEDGSITHSFRVTGGDSCQNELKGGAKAKSKKKKVQKSNLEYQLRQYKEFLRFVKVDVPFEFWRVQFFAKIDKTDPPKTQEEYSKTLKYIPFDEWISYDTFIKDNFYYLKLEWLAFNEVLEKKLREYDINNESLEKENLNQSVLYEDYIKNRPYIGYGDWFLRIYTMIPDEAEEKYVRPYLKHIVGNIPNRIMTYRRFVMNFKEKLDEDCYLDELGIKLEAENTDFQAKSKAWNDYKKETKRENRIHLLDWSLHYDMQTCYDKQIKRENSSFLKGNRGSDKENIDPQPSTSRKRREEELLDRVKKQEELVQKEKEIREEMRQKREGRPSRKKKRFPSSSSSSSSSTDDYRKNKTNFFYKRRESISPEPVKPKKKIFYISSTESSDLDEVFEPETQPKLRRQPKGVSLEQLREQYYSKIPKNNFSKYFKQKHKTKTRQNFAPEAYLDQFPELEIRQGDESETERIKHIAQVHVLENAENVQKGMAIQRESDLYKILYEDAIAHKKSLEVAIDKKIRLKTPQEQHLSMMKEHTSAEKEAAESQQMVLALIQHLALGKTPDENFREILLKAHKKVKNLENQVSNKQLMLSETNEMAKLYKVKLERPKVKLDNKLDQATLRALEARNILAAIKPFKPESGQDFKDTWRHIIMYTRRLELTEQCYIDILAILTEGDAHDIIHDYVKEGKNLDQILDTLTSLYCKQKNITDDTTALNKFKRKPNESIECAMSRVAILTEKVKHTYPKECWSFIKEKIMISVLKQIISKNTRIYIGHEEMKCFNLGATLDYKAMLSMIEAYELANAEMPTVEVGMTADACSAVPLSLDFNFVVDKSTPEQNEFKNKIEALENQINLLNVNAGEFARLSAKEMSKSRDRSQDRKRSVSTAQENQLKQAKLLDGLSSSQYKSQDNSLSQRSPSQSQRPSRSGSASSSYSTRQAGAGYRRSQENRRDLSRDRYYRKYENSSQQTPNSSPAGQKDWEMTQGGNTGQFSEKWANPGWYNNPFNTFNSPPKSYSQSQPNTPQKHNRTFDSNDSRSPYYGNNRSGFSRENLSESVKRNLDQSGAYDSSPKQVTFSDQFQGEPSFSDNMSSNPNNNTQFPNNQFGIQGYRGGYRGRGGYNNYRGGMPQRGNFYQRGGFNNRGRNNFRNNYRGGFNQQNRNQQRGRGNFNPNYNNRNDQNRQNGFQKNFRNDKDKNTVHITVDYCHCKKNNCTSLHPPNEKNNKNNNNANNNNKSKN